MVEHLQRTMIGLFRGEWISSGLVVVLLTAWVVAARHATAAEPKDDTTSITVASPNGQIRAEVFVDAAPFAQAQLQYRIELDGRPVVLPSALSVRLADSSTLGSNCVIEGHETGQIDATFEQYPGKRRLVTDRCQETTISLRERTAPERRWQLVVRAYDDGIALRYQFLAQDGWQALELSDERTEFAFPPESVATALPLASFTTSHENRYERQPIMRLPPDQLLGLPLLVELPGTGWAAILEANLTNYAGMYIAKGDDDRATLRSKLSARVDETALAVRVPLPHASPWRVILTADRLEKLVDSDTVLKLNEPCALNDVAWIKPGKTTFPWWNGYYEESVPFKPGLNTATMKHYIDFCAEYGIPYHSLDGVGNTAWYGGPIEPYEGADITKAVDGLDLPAVLEYARAKGVRLRLWMHWEAARKHMARAFPLYRQWGIEGLMIDFMDRDDQEMVNFQRELLRLAAKNQLTVTFHGVAAPTGLERTYPNLLTSEAVMNLEYDKWEPQGMAPEHDVTVALTRMLAGPLDYHQGSLRGVLLAEFQPRNEAPLVIGTPCRMLATYVVYQNHLPMMADYPTAYRAHPLTKVMAVIPVTWDDTSALAAQLDQYVAIARRHGDDWWIGAMTNRDGRELSLPLDFLGPGRFRAELYSDELAAPHRFAHHVREVTSSDSLPLQLAPAGGALVHMAPIANPPPTTSPP